MLFRLPTNLRGPQRTDTAASAGRHSSCGGGGKLTLYAPPFRQRQLRAPAARAGLRHLPVVYRNALLEDELLQPAEKRRSEMCLDDWLLQRGTPLTKLWSCFSQKISRVEVLHDAAQAVRIIRNLDWGNLGGTNAAHVGMPPGRIVLQAHSAGCETTLCLTPLQSVKQSFGLPSAGCETRSFVSPIRSLLKPTLSLLGPTGRDLIQFRSSIWKQVNSPLHGTDLDRESSLF